MVYRVFALAAVVAGALVSNGAAAAPKSAAPGAKTQTAKLTVGGMDCEGCAKGLSSKLKSTPGVKTAAIDFKSKTAIVTYDPAKIKPDTLVATAKKAGYTAQVAK